MGAIAEIDGIDKSGIVGAIDGVLLIVALGVVLAATFSALVILPILFLV